MRRTRKNCSCSHGGSRKSRKLNKRKQKSRNLNKRQLSKRVRRHQRITKVKRDLTARRRHIPRQSRGGTGGITSYSAYANFRAEGVAPSDTFKSLPAEIPVSTTRNELVGNFPFSHMDKK
jgi:hypothetical protein